MKQKTNKLLSILLALVMVAGLLPLAAIAAAIPYDLWVGGVQVDGANCDDIPAFNTGKASFDPDTNTLTLTDVSGPKGTKAIDDTWGAAILNGLSSPLTIKGTGDVTVTENNYAVYGGDIVIDPESELSFEGSSGISTDSLSVSGGTLNVNGSSNTAIHCDIINISGGTVTADGSVYGLWVGDELTVTGGVVNAIGLVGGIISYGNVSISGTNTELTAKATSETTPDIKALTSREKPTISEPLTMVKPEGGEFKKDSVGNYYHSYDGDSFATEVVIKNPDAPEYALTGFSATVPGVEEDDGYYWPKSNQTCQWTWKDDKAPDGGKTGVSFGKLWMDKEKNNPLTSEPAVGTPYYVEYTLSKDDVDFSQLTTNGCEMKLDGYTTECVELKAGTLNGEGVIPCVDILFKLTKDDPYAIKEIRVNGYESPVAGEKAGDYLNLSVPDGCHYTIVQQYWYCETAGSTINTEDEFIAGKKYSCCAYVKPEEGYQFADGVKLYANNSEDMVWSAFSHVDDNKDAFIYTVPEEATAATTTYAITVINGAAYSDAARTNLITESAAGQKVYVEYDPPSAGKYVKEITYSEGAFSQTDYMNGVTMPVKAVTFTVVYADQTEYTVDLTSGSTTAPWQACFTNVPYGVMVSLPLSPMDKDLDGDGNNDVTFSYYLYDDFVTVTKHSDTNIETSYDVTPAFSTNTPYSKVTYVFGGGIVTPDTFTVTFNANGGNVTPTSGTTGTDGKLTTLPTPTRTNYTFDGWYTAASGGEKVTLSKVYTANTTIYAHWTYNGGGGGGITTQYTLTYETNGGSAIASTKHDSGTTVNLTATPTREGFTFTGWYSDAALTNKITSIKMDGNKTVYAGWKEATPGHDCPSAHLKDVDPNAWYHEYVDYVVSHGLMQGVSADQFAPNATTTRAMIVTILYRLEGEPAVSGNSGFEDVEPDTWYSKAVAWAEANSIVNGYDAKTFGPMDYITREQMAAILYRYANFKGYDTSVGQDTNILSYDDAFDVGEWAMEAMQWACGAGLIKGRTESTIVPKGNATRAEVAAILMRFCEKVK